MATYQRKQQTVEAVQFDPKRVPWPAYITPWSSAPPELNYMGWIEAKEGRVPVSPGEWVVTEGDDDRYVCDDATFHRFYVKVEES